MKFFYEAFKDLIAGEDGLKRLERMKKDILANIAMDNYTMDNIEEELDKLIHKICTWNFKPNPEYTILAYLYTYPGGDDTFVTPVFHTADILGMKAISPWDNISLDDSSESGVPFNSLDDLSIITKLACIHRFPGPITWDVEYEDEIIASYVFSDYIDYVFIENILENLLYARCYGCFFVGHPLALFGEAIPMPKFKEEDLDYVDEDCRDSWSKEVRQTMLRNYLDIYNGLKHAQAALLQDNCSQFIIVDPENPVCPHCHQHVDVDDEAVSVECPYCNYYFLIDRSNGEARCDDFVISSGVLHKYLGKESDIIVPDGVKIIADYAFSSPDCDPVRIHLPDTVVEIHRAFYNLRELKEINIPESVRYIRQRAFAFCQKLEDVKLPPKIRRIERHAFADCRSLKRIVIPDGITHLDLTTFAGCTSLEEVILPDTLKIIDNNAFMGCGSLKRIKIPDSVTSICVNAFVGCSSLETVEISNPELLVPDVIMDTPYAEKMGICSECGHAIGSSGICIECGAKRKYV